MHLASLKRIGQKSIRTAHVVFASRRLPHKLAIYMHSLERSDYARFEDCIACLRRKGYEFVKPGEFLRGSGAKQVFLSFDDNFRAWHEALPLLNRLGVPATFYVNTLPLRDRASAEVISEYFVRIHHLGERVPLGVEEIREIRQAGHVIGAHGHSHAMLAALSSVEAKAEILACKHTLEEILGEAVVDFSYPFGMRRHFSQRLVDYCQQIGFRTVASAIPGLQHREQRPLAINRTLWRLELESGPNLQNLGVDGWLFERVTGLSPVG